MPAFTQNAANAQPALAPAYGELPPTFWEQHQTTVIIASFASLAFSFWFVKTRLRPESPKIRPPETVARQALAKLQGQPEDGIILSAVSQILRHYVSKSFNLPNQELTTAEFCAVIEVNQLMGMDLAQRLARFLRECDVRKFSPAKTAMPLNAATRALELIALAEQKTPRQDACATNNDRRI
ncbi:MAG TPA: hypothetical protein VF492_10170 [Verrucomicrobiae bacterium]